MLDVHPPHEAAHTWRDFFIHIATICIGLLIAIGLEQTVEAIHRHHRCEQLRVALDNESRQILLDTNRVETGETLDLQWIHTMETQVSDAARDHHPLDQLARRNHYGWDIPDDPVYIAAKSSGKLELLTDNETVVYGELDSIMTQIGGKYQDLYHAMREFDSFVRELDFAQPSGAKPLSTALPADLKQLHTLIVKLEVAARDMRYWSRQARGAVTALLAGERDLHKLQDAERQFDKLP